MLRITTKLATIGFTIFALTRPAVAGKKVYVGSKVSAQKLVSFDKINHEVWDKIVRKYVDGNGLVNYTALKASTEDTASLEQYLGILSTANPSVTAKRESKLAFWINAYNAVTLRGMLREYPTTSIRNHTAKLLGYNIWHDYQLVVGGKAYSLDQMEHKILRKMNEPRIHFAIVCASIGCPRLLNEAYVPDKLNQQLELNAKDFFSRSQNFRHDSASQRFYLSSLLSWFGEDFGSNQAAQLKTISKWLPSAAAKDAALKNSIRLKFLDYDWNINDQKKSGK